MSLAADTLGIGAAAIGYVEMWRARTKPAPASVAATIGLVAGIAYGERYLLYLAGAPLSLVVPAAQNIAARALLA